MNASLLYVATKDLPAVCAAAKAHGLGYEHVGPCKKCGKGVEKVKLFGDKGVAAIAGEWGKAIKGRAGAKYLPLGVRRTKDLDEGAPADEGTEPGGGEIEPYGSQVLRRLHEDATLLLQDYDQMMAHLEHPEVADHLKTKLEKLVEEMDEIEGLHGEHYKELDPLGGEEGVGEKEEGEETAEGGDEEEMPEDEAEEADSAPPEEVPDDKAVNAENKALRARVKELEGEREKSIRGRWRRKDADFGIEGAHEPGLEADREEEEKRLRRKDFPEEQRAEGEVEVTEGAGPTEGIKGLLLPHEHRAVHGAHRFLKDLASEENFGDEHRMEAFHHHKALEPVVDRLDPLGVEGAHTPGREADREEMKRLRARRKSDLGIEGPHEPGAEADREEAEKRLRRGRKDFGEMEGMDRDTEVTEEKAKALAWHKALHGACHYLKSLSTERAFGELHRAKALLHHKALDPILQEATTDLEGGQQATPHDALPDAPAPGDLGEKDMEEGGDEEVKCLRRSTAEQAKALKGLDVTVNRILAHLPG